MVIILTNKKLNSKYFVEESYEAGISLYGSEVKSLSKAEANIDEAFGYISKNNEINLINMYIKPFEKSNSFYKIIPTRKRKLLLNKKEIINIAYKCKKNKYVIIPSKVYFKNDKIKVEIVLAKSKNARDKRQDIKARDLERQSKRKS